MRCAMVMLGALVLCGCDEQGQAELRQWMEQTRRQHQPPPPALPSPQIFHPYVYDPAGRTDPFDTQKMAAGFALEQRGAGQLQPDLTRQREALEAYRLDQLKMVGSLRRAGLALGLIEVEKMIHQVRVGSYLGQDLGRVVAIGESAIELDEMVQDTSGNWVRRHAQLHLQEN